MRSTFAAAAMIGLAAVACGDAGDGDRAQAAVVRDSAGVTIVENPAPSDATPAWRLGEETRVTIGEVEAAPEYQLERVVHAERLSDGRILIADAGASALRFYGPDGVHERSTGRKGGGPGEFEQIGIVFVGADDSVRIWDWNLSRLSVFSPAGEFARTTQVAAPPGSEGSFPAPFDVLEDGRMLVRLGRAFRSGGGANGVFRDTIPILFYSPDGVPLDTLGRWAGSDVLVRSDENTVSVSGAAFGRNTIFATHGNRIYVGDNDRGEIAVHENGVLQRLIRLSIANQTVTRADIDAYRERLLAETEEDWRRHNERMLERMEYPRTMPAFGQVLTDATGNLWVGAYDPDPRAGRSWTVYDSDGELLAAVATPPGLHVAQIGEDWLVGILTDEFDLQQVVLFELDRQETDARSDR